MVSLNNYLIHREIRNFEELKKEVERSVSLYNIDKPHINLQRLTPIKFENNYLCSEQKVDSDKSATKKKSHLEGFYSPSDCEQKVSSSNIARKNMKKTNQKVN